MKTKEKLYRNKYGEYLYLFNWIGGGFNDEWGLNKREAIKKVMKERREGELKYPSHVKLRIDLKTMRRCTYSEYQQQNKMGWMLTM